MSGTEAGPSFVPHEIRITNHGKIKNWVSFALEHFKKYEDRPLVLHTLPSTKGKAPETAAAEEANAGEANAPERSTAAAEAAEKKNPKKPDGLHPSMATIPRLVSVVEIIKREYLKTLDATLAEGGCLSGLHQYNEIGDLIEAGYAERKGDDEQQERTLSLAHALQGKNHVQQKKIAFMRVTLSRRTIPELTRAGVTHQPPSVRRLSKSARARVKRKLRRSD